MTTHKIEDPAIDEYSLGAAWQEHRFSLISIGLMALLLGIRESVGIVLNKWTFLPIMACVSAIVLLGLLSVLVEFPRSRFLALRISGVIAWIAWIIYAIFWGGLFNVPMY